MKKVSFEFAPFACLFLIVQLLCTFPLAAQRTEDTHDGAFGCNHAHEISRLKMDTPPSWGVVESPVSSDNAPNVSVIFDQQEGNSLLYETVAGWTGNAAGKAQISLRIWAKNNQLANISWNKGCF